MEIDSARWSGDGTFTKLLIDALSAMPEIAAIRVEDAPASRAEAGYNFIANELFVSFATGVSPEPARWLGLVPYARKRPVFLLDLAGLGARLAGYGPVGEPDYADEGMIQYLRTERITAPYQTRGVKVIELVRIYRSGAGSR